MITSTFFGRDQAVAKVNLSMNYLSRVVRENMVLFDFDSRNEKASFLTESNLVVDCTLSEKGGELCLQDITVNEANDLYSDKSVDERVNESIHSFIGSLRDDEYADAESSFSTILSSFQSRSRISEVRAKLERRASSFTDTQNILETAEYTKLGEVRDKVVEYLKENKDALLSFEEVVNSLTLANALGKAFNVPKKTWEEVVSEGTLKIPYDTQKTVFEMVCAQELIRSELSESKENFSRSWVKNDKIASLASCIYNDDDIVLEALQTAIAAVPYLALASKSDIKTVFASIYEASDVANISQKDIREYVARIFEFKKPIKQNILGELNESYGINVQNLKFVPSFTNLAKTQSVLFEALASTCEKESIVRDVFEAFSKCLRKKGGIQALDINEFIFNLFSDAEVMVEGALFKEMDLDTLVESLFEAKDMPKKGGKPMSKKELPDEKEEPEKEEPGMDEEDPQAVDKKKKKGKKADAGEEDMNARADEASEEEEVENPEGGLGLGNEEMTDLMQELEGIFKDIDWDSLSEEEEEGDEEGSEEEPEKA
jgi:hypothetical protein